MSPGPGALVCIVLTSAVFAIPAAHRVAHEPPLGQWKVARGEALGGPIRAADLPNATMTFNADGGWRGTENGAVSGEGTWHVNEATAPATLDLTHTSGLDQGKTQLCIFSVAGDSLTLVMGVPGQGSRPTKFATTTGPPYTVLFVFVPAEQRRVPPDLAALDTTLGRRCIGPPYFC